MLVRHRLAVCAAALICAAAAPAGAHAATLTNAGGTLTYAGAAGTVSAVEFSQATAPDDTVTVDIQLGDTDPITASGCTDNGGGASFDCPAVTAIAIDTGDRDDYVALFDFRGAATVTGAAGEDTLRNYAPGSVTLNGGPGDDGLYAGGTAAEALNGGDGEDSIYIDLSDRVTGGADVLNGGPGIDRGGINVSLSAPGFSAPVDVAVSLDGVANDGIVGQGANFVDVEEASADSAYYPAVGAFQPGKATLIGNAAPNEIIASNGNDAIDAGAGSDNIRAYTGDDAISARDGYADRVDCGPGTDTAVVDTLDQVAQNCENVQAADVGNANEDKPPTIAWTAPAAGAKLGATTNLTVNAADDKAITQVQFLDDDRVVCTDTAAPYTCAYQPRGEDVGRNTLVAVASDALGQTASSVRTVTVDRFAPDSVSLTLKPAKDASAPYRFKVSGKVERPASVSASGGCKGTVAVTVKAGSKTISTRTDALSRTCAYTVTVTFSSRNRFPANGKLKVQATFRGNEVLKERRSSAKTASTK